MNLHLTEVDLSRRSARVAQSGSGETEKWYVLSAEGKLDILKLISADEAVVDRRDLATLSGSVGS